MPSAWSVRGNSGNPRPSAWRVRGNPARTSTHSPRTGAPRGPRPACVESVWTFSGADWGRIGALGIIPEKPAFRRLPEGPCAPAQPQDAPRPASAGPGDPGGGPGGTPGPDAARGRAPGPLRLAPGTLRRLYGPPGTGSTHTPPPIILYTRMCVCVCACGRKIDPPGFPRTLHALGRKTPDFPRTLHALGEARR